MVGVLIQEEKLVSRGLAEFFGKSLQLPLEELKRRYDDGFCVGRLTQEEFWDGALDEPWAEQERAFLRARRFAPDALETITRLKDRGLCVAVISDMPREWATMVLDANGVLGDIGVAVFSNDGRGTKKDGGLFDALLRETGISVLDSVLVDDRVKNLEYAEELGFGCLWLPLDPTEEQERFRRLGSLSEVLAELSAFEA